MTQLNFSPEELKSLRQVYAANATDDQFTVWLAHCKQRDLVPGQDVILQIRKSKEYDTELRAYVAKKNLVMVTTIGALRKIAERTGHYGGPLPPEWIYLDASGQPNVKSTIPLCEPTKTDGILGPRWRVPWAVIARIKRKDWSDPVQGIARFGAYAQTYSSTGEDQEKTINLNQMWKTRGPEQLAKCAEAAAFREGFPETEGLYIPEELNNQEPPEDKTPAPTTPAPTVVATPQVNQVPAQPGTDSRPQNEQPVPAPVTTVPSLVTVAYQLPPHVGSKAILPTGEIIAAVDPRITEGLKKIAEESKITPATEAFVESLMPDNAPPAEPAEPVQTGGGPELPDPLTEIATKAEDDAVPNKEELKAFGTNFKARKIDSELLKAWLLKFTGAPIVKKVTRKQWKDAIAKLDAVTELGQAALDGLLKGAA